ncbi:MAG: hypothetical protein FWF03_07020 [Defluviitaleaceae bacterium]|nr:hypothetical protein [Defluviitaleaceae bacterium]
MKAYFLRFAASVLIFSLLLPMAAACSGAGKKSGATAKLTFKSYSHPDEGFADWSSTPVGQFVKEKFNIEIEIYPSQFDDALQDMVTDIAANNLADLSNTWMVSSDPGAMEVVQKAAREGILQDISKEVKNHPTLNRVLQKEGLSFFKQNILFDPAYNGALYYLPIRWDIQGWLSGWGLYIRGDIAEALNVSTPSRNIKTTDDLYNLLVRIRDGNFKDVNGNDIYPLGSIDHWTHIMQAMTRPFDFGGSAYIGIEGGNAKSFFESDYAWNQIQWMRKLIDERLLDPESLTHAYEIGSERISQARYAVTAMFCFMPTDWGAYTRALREVAPEMCYKPLGNMNTHKGTQTFVRSAAGSFQTMFFSKGADIGAWLPFLEWANSKEGRATLAMGIEGEQWFWNSAGYAQFTEEAYAEYINDINAYNRKYGAYDYFGEIAAYDDPQTNPFGSGGSNYTFQNDPTDDNLRRINGEGTTPDWTYDVGMPLSVLINDYPEIESIRPILNEAWDILTKAYLVKTDDEAKKVLEDYLANLKKNGLDGLLGFVQDEYGKNPDKWADYATEA